MKLNNIPALSAVLLGVFLAAADYHVNVPSAICLILSAVNLQILSDISAYAPERKKLKTIFLLLSIASGLACLHLSFGSLFLMESLVLMVIGYFSISYAKNSRMVSSPGAGDVYRFLLYGPAALYGTYFVCSHSFGSIMLLLPAASSAFLAIALLGSSQQPAADRRSSIYRIVLIFAALAAMTLFSCMRIYDIMHFIHLLTLPLFIWASVLIWKASARAKGALSLSILLFSLLSGMGYIAYLVSLPSDSSEILVEAEEFENKGGWAVDQQFTFEMGSPYLLAHGIGKPVEDAVTEVKFRSKGTYHVFVRTYNWTSPTEKTEKLMQYTSTTYLEVLTAQQSLLQARTSQAQDRYERISAVINLYRALGGGQF